MTNLQILMLWGNKLTTLPSEIWNLINLQHLSLSGNPSIILPSELWNLTNLQELVLWNNKLTTLPPEIGNLTNLQKLELIDNKLTTLPPEIGNLTNLQELYLCNNQLTTLPPEIGNLTNLQRLDLSGNPSIILPPEIGNLTNLQELVLWNNKLTTLPLEIGNLISLENFDYDDLLNNSTWEYENGRLYLESLNVGWAPIFVDLMKTLGNILYEKEHLTTLDASNSNLEEVPNIIVEFKKLKKIDLGYNPKINSIDKVSDGVFGLPELESLILTTSEGDKEYNQYEIAEIRKQRIQALEEKLMSKEKIRRIVDLLHMGKNESSVNLKEVQSRVDSLKKRPGQLFYEKMLKNLKEAQKRAADPSFW